MPLVKQEPGACPVLCGRHANEPVATVARTSKPVAPPVRFAARRARLPFFMPPKSEQEAGASTDTAVKNEAGAPASVRLPSPQPQQAAAPRPPSQPQPAAARRPSPQPASVPADTRPFPSHPPTDGDSSGGGDKVFATTM